MTTEAELRRQRKAQRERARAEFKRQRKAQRGRARGKRQPLSWERVVFIGALLAAFVTFFWPPFLGIILALWLVVYLLGRLAASLHP